MGLHNTLEVFDPSGVRWAVPAGPREFVAIGVHPEHDGRVRLRLDATEVYLPRHRAQALRRALEIALDSPRRPDAKIQED